MKLNATFKKYFGNIVAETGVPGENIRPAASHGQPLWNINKQTKIPVFKTLPIYIYIYIYIGYG